MQGHCRYVACVFVCGFLMCREEATGRAKVFQCAACCWGWFQSRERRGAVTLSGPQCGDLDARAGLRAEHMGGMDGWKERGMMDGWREGCSPNQSLEIHLQRMKAVAEITQDKTWL